MPVLAKFYGIVIRMFRVRGMPARFHAIYENSELVVEIEPLRIVQGSAPMRMADMVLEWARAHQTELLCAWQSVSCAQRPTAIAPLT